MIRIDMIQQDTRAPDKRRRHQGRASCVVAGRRFETEGPAPVYKLATLGLQAVILQALEPHADARLAVRGHELCPLPTAPRAGRRIEVWQPGNASVADRESRRRDCVLLGELELWCSAERHVMVVSAGSVEPNCHGAILIRFAGLQRHACQNFRDRIEVTGSGRAAGLWVV